MTVERGMKEFETSGLVLFAKRETVNALCFIK